MREMDDCRRNEADQKAKMTMITASEIGARISDPNPLPPRASPLALSGS
jgi:hypothetical protein